MAGDCIEILSKVKAPFADLIFADPPFNIGYKYDKYKDKKKADQYLAWSEDWIKACYNVLKPAGSFYIAIGDEYAAELKIIAQKTGLILRNWIIWHYTFGQQTKTKFARSHTHIFYFVKDKTNFTFNDYAVRTPSDRQLIYNDKRANSTGKMPDDVWNTYSRVCGTFNERQNWQMPEVLLARIIATSSNKCDFVIDPFIGSGTTAAVALQYDRKYLGIDISETYAENCRQRLKEIEKQKHSSKKLFLSQFEYAELKRLYYEVGLSASDIINSSKLSNIFAKQFAIRMNNGKKYNPDELCSVLAEFTYERKK